MVNETRKKTGMLSLTVLKNSAIAISALNNLPSFTQIAERIERFKENRERKSGQNKIY